MRRRLDTPDPELDFPILEDLREQGATAATVVRDPRQASGLPDMLEILRILNEKRGAR